ncbi:hypothetical protein BV22DRAFT_97224 [Leucogyrophana mollusca]|uniref:Uncharacterized protein n=1 Tax=Leucogyrophana mollusca TaxID=85980 RepID=A0ACB8BVM8_9AGAM|nr:hypothetical protein BV22DRAFT_97224 [Leucogyrophana mollusca]
MFPSYRRRSLVHDNQYRIKESTETQFVSLMLFSSPNPADLLQPPWTCCRRACLNTRTGSSRISSASQTPSSRVVRSIPPDLPRPPRAAHAPRARHPDAPLHPAHVQLARRCCELVCTRDCVMLVLLELWCLLCCVVFAFAFVLVQLR